MRPARRTRRPGGVPPPRPRACRWRWRRVPWQASEKAQGCARVRHRAEQLFDRRDPGDDPAWIAFVNAEELAGEAAHCYRRARGGSARGRVLRGGASSTTSASGSPPSPSPRSSARSPTPACSNGSEPGAPATTQPSRVVWMACDPDSMRDYLEARDAARDTWKLSFWDDYLTTIDPGQRPLCTMPSLIPRPPALTGRRRPRGVRTQRAKPAAVRLAARRAGCGIPTRHLTDGTPAPDPSTRPRLDRLTAAGRVPVVHIGQIAGIAALHAGYPARWLAVLLWCPREVCRARLRDRGNAWPPGWTPGTTRVDVAAADPDTFALILPHRPTTAGRCGTRCPSSPHRPTRPVAAPPRPGGRRRTGRGRGGVARCSSSCPR
jgi:hypothetical protein